MEEIGTSAMFYFHFSFAGYIDPKPEISKSGVPN